LSELAKLLAVRKNCTLLGFNDISKHLANMYPENVVAIQDSKISEDMNYRGIPIRGMEKVDKCESAILCDFAGLYKYKKIVEEIYKGAVSFAFANSYSGSSAKVVDFSVHDTTIESIFSSSASAPPTMMSKRDIFQILQFLEHCLDIEGDVAEVGAWQGGSAWYIAQYLAKKNSRKAFFVYEMGEELDRTNPQGIVCEDEMKRSLSFYPTTKCHFGSALPHLEELEKTRLSFVFLDFGYSEKILDILYDKMTPGAVIILDNYGHTLGHPDKFDLFFEKRGNSVIRSFGSPTGIVIKK